ncbi:MAG: tetratricopeptide repeat protein, partial [Candidatus Omnitrophica bacterium]|nr:tetratricopeptide repeat protein [Candidatus Omnitrophota bacterium]
MICYQKAITLDPNFAVVYNDLGIIYEAKGSQDKAEEVYLTGLKVNPRYATLYSNLAMLYEQRQEYSKAAEFWKKRVELGKPDDPWTMKAKQRLIELREAVPELKQEYLRQQSQALAEELSIKRQEKRIRELTEANKLLEDAKHFYQ